MGTNAWNCKIADEISELVLSFDKNGRILQANRTACEKLGYSDTELTDCRIPDIFRQSRPETEGESSDYSRDDFIKETETNMYRKNGVCFPVLLRFLVMEDGTDYLLAEDVTERYKISAALQKTADESEQNRRMRNEFIANVTHEMRTPVNGIKGHVMDLLEQSLSDKQRKSLELVLYCCDNISSLINNILDFSKIEAGKFVLEEREFDFYKMIDHVIETHMPSIREKGLKFGIHIDEAIPQYIVGDELRINQILNNILSNAVKFTGIGGIVLNVSMTMQKGSHLELFFMIKDSGIGISKENQDKLFMSFQQLDASITRKYGGTGLGLAVTKQLIELMDGRIYVESDKGKGSTFSFNLVLHAGQNGKTRKELDETYRTWQEFAEFAENEDVQERVYLFGSEENRAEINKNLEKLMLSIELNSWEKAERIAGVLKLLCENSGSDVKRNFLRMDMAIRKEDYEKSLQGLYDVKAFIDSMLAESQDK